MMMEAMVRLAQLLKIGPWVPTRKMVRRMKGETILLWGQMQRRLGRMKIEKTLYQ